jgi:ribosomal-protein-serine acetyltransferase
MILAEKNSGMFSCKISDKISLRLLDPNDEDKLFRLIDKNREYLGKWLPWVANNRKTAQTKAFIEESLRAFRDKSRMQCGIFFDGELVGAIGFHYFDWLNKSTSIGYWLGEDQQGQGIVSACVKTLMRHAFTELGLHRIEIRCAKHNLKSRKISERLGFKKEGLLREAEFINKKYVDQVLYSFLANDFKI